MDKRDARNFQPVIRDNLMEEILKFAHDHQDNTFRIRELHSQIAQLEVVNDLCERNVIKKLVEADELQFLKVNWNTLLREAQR
jgi:hypothetical protein